MVKHIVMWDVRGKTPEQKKETADAREDRI